MATTDSVKTPPFLLMLHPAYKFFGLGILAVHGIPEVGKLREAVFRDGYKFANFDSKVKAKYEHKESYYSFGWSHGKEKLQGHPDYSKGSFYNNPLVNQPYTDPKMIKEYPTFATGNVWPADELPSLEKNFMELGQLIVKVGVMIASQCDKFIESKCATYDKGRLARMLSSNKACKARLLHYFPINERKTETTTEDAGEASGDPFSDWCGWHNDHSSLTGLALGQFVDTSTGKFIPNPDSDAGLHIRSRKGKLYKVSLPKNNSSITAQNTLLFQIGESAQIHSGGLLQATPHAVRGANVPGVSRESYAVFMQPAFDEKMDVPKGIKPENAQSSEAAKQLPGRVPSLASRYGTKGCPFSTCNFAAFTEESLSKYH